MARYFIKIDRKITEFTTIDYDWVNYNGFSLGEPFYYNHATDMEKNIADIIIEKLYLEFELDSIICIDCLEELPKIRIEMKD